MPWRFHAGDDARWASPTFDDQNWQRTKTGFSVGNTPPGWKGIGWFRLHFTLDQALVGQLLAFRIAHMGASEIYLDGQRIGGFGKVGRSLATETTYLPNHEPITLRVNQPGEHVLAVRLSVFHRYLTRSVRNGQGFLSWIAPYEQMLRHVNSVVRRNDLSLIPAIGSGLFALLHLFLYLFYPAQKSNLYYSGCLAFFAAAAFCVYAEYLATSPATQQAIFYLIRLVNLAYIVTSVTFVYSVYYPTQPRQILIFYGIAAVLFLLLVLFPAWNDKTAWLTFLAIGTLEILRVVILGMIRRQPGIWLIGVGMVAAAFAFFLSAGNVQILLPGNAFSQGLIVPISFLVLPFSTSLYLAQDFARTSRSLEAQLKRVRALSVQALAQEAEKLTLVARQNEQLEQTVRERTQEIQQQADKLREVDAIKSRFFTNLAHEFRTPLTLMLGPAEQVLAKTQEEQTRQQVGILERNTQRLLQLVNQLLDLSKLEAGKTKVVATSEDMISLVRGTLFSFESLAHQKQIALHLTTTPDQLVMDLDRDKLEKILSNLVGNALKFTPVGGAVSVMVTREDVAEEPWVNVAVQDTGIGIPADKLPHVFNQFYQVDSSDQREQEGFGIGLALTKELVELHGGYIDITSPEGVGTLVTVCLPIRQEQQETAEIDSPALVNQGATPMPVALDPSPEDHDAAELLVIEDNDEVRHFIRLSLQNQYRILEAAGGEEGVRLAQQHIPDLVITDLMMPRMDGYQVCQALKQDERTSHIPVIMLTAKADLESRIEGLQTGADSYVAKPFHQRELLAQISNLISMRRQLRERYSRNTLGKTSAGVASPGVALLPSIEQAFLNRVRTLVDAHLDDERFSVEQLSDEMGLSRTQLHRKLKALIDQSPGDLIRAIRLQHALTLLTQNVATVSEVAYRVGFANPASFSASFSRHFGYAPNEVKKKMGSSAS